MGLTIEKVRRCFRADNIDGVLDILKASIADLPIIENPMSFPHLMRESTFKDCRVTPDNDTATSTDLPTIVKKDKCENYYESITHLIFRYTGFQVFSEQQNICGRSDVVVTMKNSVFIFELKMDKGRKWEEVADEGLKQIEERKYAEKFAQAGKGLFKTAIVFFKRRKRHSRLEKRIN